VWALRWPQAVEPLHASLAMLLQVSQHMGDEDAGRPNSAEACGQMLDTYVCEANSRMCGVNAGASHIRAADAY
jgi:hypothetical protein